MFRAISNGPGSGAFPVSYTHLDVYKRQKEVIDAKGNYVFPGIIDCHAHLNEPGFEYREDFETGSRAAVVAGCTTCLLYTSSLEHGT